MAVITMRQMLEAGVHFGHQTRRWNPKMKRFIFGERNGIYIIDLEQTLTRVETAYNFVRDLVAGGGVICSSAPRSRRRTRCAATPRSAACPTSTSAGSAACSPTSTRSPSASAKMLEYERMQASGEFDAMPKKEALLLTRELEKLQRNLGGIRNMDKRPDAVFMLDTKKEHIAVTEANKLGIPVVAVVDTNVDPERRAVPDPRQRRRHPRQLAAGRVIADAVEEGRYIASKREPAGCADRRAPPSRRPSSTPSRPLPVAQAAAAQLARERRLETAQVGGADDDELTESVAESTADAAEAIASQRDRGVRGARMHGVSDRSAPDRSTDEPTTGVGSASEQPDRAPASQQTQ